MDVARLQQRITAPVEPHRGFHACEFCPKPPIKRLPSGIEIPDWPAEALGKDQHDYLLHCPINVPAATTRLADDRG